MKIMKKTEEKIKNHLIKIGKFPDEFKIGKTIYTMTHYDLKGHILQYEDNKNNTIEIKTIISRYSDIGKFNPESIKWSIVEIY